MELKFNYFIDWYNESLRSNRTFMELKLEFAKANGDNIKF